MAQAVAIAEGRLQGRVTERVLPITETRGLREPELTKVLIPGETLFDAWQDVIGSVEGIGKTHSKSTSERFAQAMLEKKQTGHL